MGAMINSSTVEEASREMRDGDLIFFKGTSFISKTISAAGGCPVTHVGMVHKKWIWGRRVIYLAEMREFRGGVCEPLEDAIQNRKGGIYWIRLDPENRFNLNRNAIISKMLEFTDRKYNYWQVLRAGVSHLPIIRYFYKPSLSDVLQKNMPLFCSACCGHAIQFGGQDTVHFLANAWTEPCALYRSLIHDGKEILLEKISQ